MPRVDVCTRCSEESIYQGRKLQCQVTIFVDVAVLQSGVEAFWILGYKSPS